MSQKSKHLGFILICILTQNFYAQQIIYTKGKSRRVHKSSYITYSVNGTMYQIPGSYLKSDINHTGLLNYYVGYDPFDREKGRLYFDKPYFDEYTTPTAKDKHQ